MQLSIRAKLTTGLGLMLGLFLAAASVFYFQTREVGKRVRAVTEVAEPLSHAALEMEINLIGTGFAVLGYLHDRDPLHLARIENMTDNFIRFQKRYHALAADSEAKRLGEKVDEGYARFRELSAILIRIGDEQAKKLAALDDAIDRVDKTMHAAAASGAPGRTAADTMQSMLAIAIKLHEVFRYVHSFMHIHKAGLVDLIEDEIVDLRARLDHHKTLASSPGDRVWIDAIEESIVGLVRDIFALNEVKKDNFAEFVRVRHVMDDVLDDKIRGRTQNDIDIAERATHAALALTNATILGLLAVGLVLGVATAFATLRGVWLPIQRFVAATQQVERGHLATVEVAETRGEFATLAFSFNHMVAARWRAEEETRSAHDRLERQVAERTAALTEANAALRAEAERRERYESQLVQAQKMEAIGHLTGGIAHDFNNLLGIVIGNVELAREILAPQSGAVMPVLDTALDAALRGAALNKRLLAFARRQPLRPDIVDLNALLKDMTDLIVKSVGERVQVRFDLAGTALPVTVDRAQLESTVVNLAVNARDAMPAGGRLSIDTNTIAVDERLAISHGELEPGDYATLSIADTGTGIADESLSHIFEPFFTTKEAGHGTGLGLAMVWGFVKQSGGHVSVYSELGHGTVFRVYLPLAEDAAATARRAQDEETAPARGRGELVLVVEDNPEMRLTTVRQLADLGYRTVEAANAEQALKILRSPQPVSLLFSDVVMPGRSDGMALALDALRHRPGLPVLLASGFMEKWCNADFPLPAPLLTKPYRKSDLARAVRRAIDEGAAATENSTHRKKAIGDIS